METPSYVPWPYDRDVVIEVIVRLPWAPEVMHRQIIVSEFVAEVFEPLPRDREIPWELSAMEQARKMAVQRQELAEHLAERLTAEILAAVRSRDPQNGYSPEEWKAINNPPTTDNPQK